MIQRFDVLHWNDDSPRDQRIIWIDLDRQRVYTINIVVGNKRIVIATPEEQHYDEILDALEVKRAEIIPDIYRPIIRQDDLKFGMHVEKRDAYWEIIKPLLYDADRVFRTELFDPHIRGLLIRDILHRHALSSESLLRSMLTRVLQGTCSPNDLFPRYANCGGPGKTRPHMTFVILALGFLVWLRDQIRKLPAQ